MPLIAINKSVTILFDKLTFEDVNTLLDSNMINNLEELKNQNPSIYTIIANCYNVCFDDIVDKVYTRELFSRN